MSPFNLAIKVPNKRYVWPNDYKPICVGIVRLSSKRSQSVEGDLRILSRVLKEVVKGKSEEERQQEEIDRYNEQAAQNKARLERAWLQMQESRRDKGYKKRAWWDKEGKYHFDYGDDRQPSGDNEFNTGKDEKTTKRKKRQVNSDSEDGLAEFGL